jgi:pimeloyl-ACP methyl ester carboxylesterase
MSLTLPDGRNLDYREFGAPDGYPIVNNHGGLVCGLDISPAHETAVDLGLRIISPDRPGVGWSSPLPGRVTADWADDVRALLEHLKVERCSGFGWSLGSEYALALGAAGVVERIVVVGGVPPMGHGELARLNRTDRALAALSLERPGVARTVFAGMRAVAPLVHSAARHLSSSEDQSVLSECGDFPTWVRQALRQPDGMVEEYRAMCRPWGFEPADVTCDVEVWQGALDEYVTADLGRDLAQELPHARYHEVPDAGHFLAYRRWHQVLSALCP